MSYKCNFIPGFINVDVLFGTAMISIVAGEEIDELWILDDWIEG